MDLTPSSREDLDEQARIASLLNLLPPGGHALEIGARNGLITRLIANRYTDLVALDLECPAFSFQNVRCVAGDVRKLPWPDKHFEVVLCSEVLEHLPADDLQSACDELVRISRDHLLIGVPFEQDLRVARTRCQACGTINPPYGHVNRFTTARLMSLFKSMSPVRIEEVGRTTARTNAVSDLLMRAAGYPWGSYEQDEPCLNCGRSVGPAPMHSPHGRVLAQIAMRIDQSLQLRAAPRAKWLHILFADSCAESHARMSGFQG